MVYLTVRRAGGGAGRGFERGGSSHWNRTEGEQVAVTAYSNCAETELFLNGRSLGTGTAAANMGPVFVWETPYESGELKAVGKIDGKAVCEYVMKTAGEAKKVMLKADAQTLKANGVDVCHLEFAITDEKGVIVPNAENLVRFYISGPARLLAVGNGNPANHENETDAEHNVWQGQGLAVVQALKEQGNVTVSASSPGLDGMDITLAIR